jgi:tetratricopeptide (TPR) repeat protein
VLAGSVRKAGNRIRLVAQLTTVADGYQVWSDTYDRELRDVFAVQDEVAQAIARALQVRLAPAAGAATRTQGTVNVDAYTHYLRGRFHWARRTEAELAKGLLHFQQALALDPDYALAEIGIADSYNLLGFYDWIHPREAFPRALAAAERALTLDDNLAAAHCSRAYVRLYHEWNWAAAEDGFRRAEALAPAYATASHQYGNLLVTQGRFAEAEAAMRRALASEPMALITNACIGWAEYYAGKWEASIAHHRATIELDASFMLAHLWLGQSLLQAGAAEDAVEEFETALRLSGRSAIALAALARALVVAGRRAESDRLVSELDELAQRRFVPQYDVATIHAAAGDADRAFARLDQALREREHELVFLAVDPALVSLRGDPRFAALVARVGL